MSDHERRSELRRFLKDRRARISPAEAGLPPTGRRRVPGLRREEVASLAGIGVSWYTALESGDAAGVSEETVLAISEALRLSPSERTYLLTLTGRLPVADEQASGPRALLTETMRALAFPAYIITASWDVVACNDAFRLVWGIEERELPFNAVERLFMEPAARRMHGKYFVDNVAPIVAMVRSAVGRRPHLDTLQRLRAKLVADPETLPLWNAYEVRDPLVPNRATIESPLGRFSYEALTLANPGETSGLVVHVPDSEGRALLARAARGDESVDGRPSYRRE
ncbi:MAG TPA: helix-turn-helix domain-containing protein [Candidatus Sulfotelmatobacter sp.]|nr:helix-turn-helix domain-containing protein [Candidatus Sulfotelmatobacter sp.]